ncbi:hypothetical protein ACK3Y9_13550, partial [Aeromonas caviae]
GVFGDSQFTSTLSVNFHFPKIPRRTKNKPCQRGKNEHDPAHIIVVTGSGKVTFYFVRINATL